MSDPKRSLQLHRSLKVFAHEHRFLLKPFIVLNRYKTQVEERHDFTKHKDFHEDGNSQMQSDSKCQDTKPCGCGPNQNRKQDEFIKKCCVRHDTSQNWILR